MTNGLVIRRAGVGDARNIVEAHHAAIREKAAAHYPAEVINAWAPEEISDARVAKLEDHIAAEEFLTLVAELGGEIIGFGQVNASKNVLGAVYVRKNPVGGVGERILTELIAHAKAQGCRFLAMDSSTNAEAFYRRNGFRTTGYGKHHISSAKIDMDCVHMMLKME
ncbi:MAG: GNAT family N-acetyltransferase [Alphaproteobacteria bacterium]|nr:GNAT family N-acetyltransferase [Alphaproteobacteria bacterium]